MRIQNINRSGPTQEQRVVLINCIISKLHRMDMDSLRNVYQTVAKIMDDLKKAD